MVDAAVVVGDDTVRPGFGVLVDCLQVSLVFLSRGCYQSVATGGVLLELPLCGGIRCIWLLVQERAWAATAYSLRMLITRLTGTLRDFFWGAVRGHQSACRGTVPLGVVLAGIGIIGVGGGGGGWGRLWYKSRQIVGVVTVPAFGLCRTCAVWKIEAFCSSWGSFVW